MLFSITCLLDELMLNHFDSECSPECTKFVMEFKVSYLTLVMKKTIIAIEGSKNYKTVSILWFPPKLIERVVCVK